MKRIKETPNEHHWPRHEAKQVECRKRDLVIRITDWLDDEQEPAYDVETYIGGVYDWNESQVFSLWASIDEPRKTKAQAKQAAIEYAQKQIARLL